MTGTGRIRIDADGATCRIVLSGDIDIHTVDITDHDLEPCSTAERVEIDMTEVAFLDSVGVSLLLRVRQAAPSMPALRRPSAQVVRLLDLVGVAERVETVDSETIR